MVTFISKQDCVHADAGRSGTPPRTLDFTGPIALILLEVLNYILKDEDPHAIVTRLLDAMPAGSYLLLSHPTAQVHRAAMLKYTQLWNEHATPVRCPLRSSDRRN